MLLAEYRHKRTIRYYSVNIKICWPPFYIYHHVVGPPHIRLHSLCILQGGGRGEFHTGAFWQLIDPIIKCNYPKTGKGAKVSKEQAQAKRRRQTKKKPAKSQMKSHTTGWYFILVLKKHFTRSLRSLVKYFSTLKEKFRISARPCNILYL